ncbi:30S ribosomal protein S14 [Nocardioides sp. IC4_145]|uniref:30S ribosomal protein S14 n=1 Tax=Nocardioides sp. IC4_145 TaxID=2714037 RepID=UPI001407DEAA|nr:30S ribosomal protein S14 [Nocardioides sp. IC4_145]NHC23455.1 30S ribosomal protein S14 [Nocardioides sp. IC4_145]
MAKKSKVAAQRRREQVVARYAERRAALKDTIRTAEPGSLEHSAAVRALSRLPRDSSPVRLRNRDQVDGRPRGHLRKFGVSRITFRGMAHRGELPGVTKSSW